MYPNLYYIFKDLFHLDLPFLKVVNSFGFFVAIAFLVSAWLLGKELKRREKLGVFTFNETTITIGKPASMADLLVNAFLGFTLGYKIIGVFITEGALNNPQAFIFSKQGNWGAGILLALFFAGLKWWEKNKEKLAKPETRTLRIWPSDRVGDITIISAAGGFVGAKIFDNLENWDRFIKDPIGNLLSPSGLTFYGGLIVAILALWYYFHKNNISFIRVADTTAPVLLLSYSMGRIGCQVAGDGDWGIYNPHVNPYSWLPDILWSYDYPHNVNGEGVPMMNCDWGDYCNHLPAPVYPTPLYEIIICFILFLLLWSVRKRFTTTGRLFSVYLILNGLERFFIEKIRVNTEYDIFSYHPTQAELISSLLVIAGVVLYIYAPKIYASKQKSASA